MNFHCGFILKKNNQEDVMHKIFFIFILLVVPFIACANIPSTEYVQQQIASQIATAVSSKVDTSASANQTMAGTYTITGTVYAPTPTLPTAE